MGYITRFFIFTAVITAVTFSFQSGLRARTCSEPATFNCDHQISVSADEFVPSYGTVKSYNAGGGKRYVFIGYVWDTSVSGSWYHLDELNTMETNLGFPGNSPYTTNFDPPFLAESGSYNPPKSVVVMSSNYPCPYAKTKNELLGETDPMIITGTACADSLAFGSSQVYTSISKVNIFAETGDMWVTFERGHWKGFSFLDDMLCFNGDTPVWDLAPMCIWECCTNNNQQINNFPIIPEAFPLKVPGCYDWFYTGSGSVTLANCAESICNDGIDNDMDGLTDCDDPDCNSNPACALPPDPCADAINGEGYYCGGNLIDYQGNINDRVYCSGYVTQSTEPCEDGCIEDTPGHARCNAACTPNCSANDAYCSGQDVYVCSADLCSYEFSETCGADQTCAAGYCVDLVTPAPVITDVTCTTMQRGLAVTCTITGSNFTAGGNTSIDNCSGSGVNGGVAIISINPTQIVVQGTWICDAALGVKNVNHRNGDNQTASTTVATVMGPIMVLNHWPDMAGVGAVNVPVGFFGCNFGSNPAIGVDGLAISNIQMINYVEVHATGTVTVAAGFTGKKCIAKTAGDTDPFNKWCCTTNCFSIQ